MLTRPMLAGKVTDPVDLAYPVVGNPKLDGIRALRVGGQLVSRSFKPIRNEHIQRACAGLPEGLDGELVVPDGAFQDTTSAVMSYDGRPDFEYWVFDWYGAEPYTTRVSRLCGADLPPFVRVVQPTYLESVDGLLRYEDAALSAGYEGVILRDPEGPYKCGRSSVREGWMLKLKRYEDSEAVVLYLVEANENQNPQVPDAFGLMKRPGGSANRVPKGTLGAFGVRDVHTGVDFEIGTGRGLTQAMRFHIWSNQSAYVGRVVKYTYQPTGVKDRPRFPSFVSFRDADDA